MKNRSWTPTQAFPMFDVDSDKADPLPLPLGITVTCCCSPGPSPRVLPWPSCTSGFLPSALPFPLPWSQSAPLPPAATSTLIPVIKALMHYPKEKKKFSLTNSLKYFPCTVPLVWQPRIQLTKSSSQSDVGDAVSLSLPPETGKEKLKGGLYHWQTTIKKSLEEQIARSKFHDNDSINMGNVKVTCDMTTFYALVTTAEVDIHVWRWINRRDILLSEKRSFRMMAFTTMLVWWGQGSLFYFGFNCQCPEQLQYRAAT